MDDLADWVNQKILNLWREKFGDAEGVCMPLIYSEIKTSVLLFVSLNPSFTTKGFNKMFANTDLQSKKVEEALLNWSNSESLQLVKEFEKLSRDKGSFFKKFKEISKCANIDWEHIDLFFYRTTSQDKFLPHIYDNESDKLTEFGRRQLDLSKQLISKIDPITIVVANAFASQIFEQEFCAKFNKNLGYHEINLYAYSLCSQN